MTNWCEEKNLTTVKDLKDFLAQFDENMPLQFSTEYGIGDGDASWFYISKDNQLVLEM